MSTIMQYKYSTQYEHNMFMAITRYTVCSKD